MELVLGLLLLAASVRGFRARPDRGEAAPTPTWMDGIASFAPGSLSLSAPRHWP